MQVNPENVWVRFHKSPWPPATSENLQIFEIRKTARASTKLKSGLSEINTEDKKELVSFSITTQLTITCSKLTL